MTDTAQHVSYQPMPCHNELFTGHKHYLGILQQDFIPQDKSHPRRFFLVYGMGGAGKTDLLARAW